MTKLHEVLAAEKTVAAAWTTLYEDSMRKLSNPSEFLFGYSKSLNMIEDTPANKVLEEQAAEEKRVTTNVVDTLDYALRIYGNLENVQLQKNATNRVATADVIFRGRVVFSDLPVDQLLGLESRLEKIKALYLKMPTLAGSKEWVPAGQNVWRQKDPEVNTKTEKVMTTGVWRQKDPEVNTKTEKVMTPVVMAQATDKHPAQVQAVTKDYVVGKTTTVNYSGACTTDQKADALKLIDELMVAVKQARMRANETEVVVKDISGPLVELLMSPFKN